MSDEEETPEVEPEKPKRRPRIRRRSIASDSEAAPSSEAATRASDADATSESQGGEAEAANAPPTTDVDPQAEEEREPVDAEPPTAEPAVQSEPEKRQRVPTRPAPSRRRAQREPGAPIPVVRAQAKYVHSSPRKARLVCDHIRGKTVVEARAILAHTPRDVARDWSKLLESAVANAEHNHELVGEDLYVMAVTANDGPTIKRFRPRAMGRATQIRKRTSHLMISLTSKE